MSGRLDPHALRKANLAPYLSEDSETHGAIVRALSRLPDDVLEFAVSKCVFVSAGGALYGQCLSTRFLVHAEWFILIYDESPDLETVISHEVAHAYLGHSIDDPLPDDETERQARDLTRKWGFTGKGADS